jgi:hypothetical protein
MAMKRESGGSKKPPRKPVAKSTAKKTTTSSARDYSQNYAKPKVTQAQRNAAKKRTQADIDKGNKLALNIASVLPAVRGARLAGAAGKTIKMAARDKNRARLAKNASERGKAMDRNYFDKDGLDFIRSTVPPKAKTVKSGLSKAVKVSKTSQKRASDMVAKANTARAIKKSQGKGPRGR